MARTGYVPSLGMRGTGTWSDNENPGSWREGILYLYPNGSAPLTAILSKAKSRHETEEHFHWWTKTLSTRAGAISAITDPGTGSAYVSGAAAGDSLRMAVTGAFSHEIVNGHNVLLRKTGDHSEDVVGKVTNVQRGTDSGLIDVTLAQADQGDLANVDRLIILSNSNPEGSVWPESVAYHPTEMENLLQIIRSPLRMTGTALNKKKLRTGDAYKEMKRETLEYHSIDIEQALLWGIMTTGTGSNGQPERTMMGIREFISTYNPAGIIDCARTLDYAGQVWTDYSRALLDNAMMNSFMYGKSTEKTVLAGSGAILGIQQMVTANSQYNISQGESKYGIRVLRLESAFGVWNIVRAPLFNHEPSNRNSMFVLDIDNIKFVYSRDTDFWPDVFFGKGGPVGLDGKVEGFLTEASLELYFPETFMYLSNVGVDSVLSS